MTNPYINPISYFAVAQVQAEIDTEKQRIYEHLRRQVPTSQNANYGIIDKKGESTMSENASYTKNEIDLKFQNIEQKIDSKFELLSQKIDTLPLTLSTQFENMLLKNNATLDAQTKELQKESSNNQKWFIGTAIAIAGIVIPLIISFLQQK